MEFACKLSLLIIFLYFCTEILLYMIIEFEDEELKILISTHNSTDKRYKKLKSNMTFLRDLDKVMLILRSTKVVADLAKYQQLHYEKLKYELSGKSSVRIGYTSKYRLIFEEIENGIKIKLIEINEHYGDK